MHQITVKQSGNHEIPTNATNTGHKNIDKSRINC